MNRPTDELMSNAEDFAAAFEQRLRQTLISAAKIGGPEAALLGGLNASINFALLAQLPADAVAELLRGMADEVQAHRAELGRPDPATLN